MSKPIFIVTVPNISWDSSGEIQHNLFKTIGSEYHCFIVNDCNKKSFEFQMFSEKLIEPIELERLKELVLNGEHCESVERTDERKYKHVVTFDMNKIVEKNNKEIAEMLSRGNIVLTDQEGKPYYINTDDVKPITISQEDYQTTVKKVNEISDRPKAVLIYDGMEVTNVTIKE